MLFKYILPTLLASMAVAIPVADIDQDLVLFKRDDILEARDLELADIHGVNLTESKPLQHAFSSTSILMAISVQALHVQARRR